MTVAVCGSFQAQIPFRERQRESVPVGLVVGRVGSAVAGWVEVSSAFSACCCLRVPSKESWQTPSAAFGVPPTPVGVREGAESRPTGPAQWRGRQRKWLGIPDGGHKRENFYLQGARLPRQSVRQQAASSPGHPLLSLSSCVLAPLCLSVLRPQIPNSSPHGGANPLRSPRAPGFSILW